MAIFLLLLPPPEQRITVNEKIGSVIGFIKLKAIRFPHIYIFIILFPFSRKKWFLSNKCDYTYRIAEKKKILNDIEERLV